MLVVAGLNVTEARLRQPVNTLLSTVVTASGKVKLVSAVQLWKALTPMVAIWHPSSNTTSVRAVQPWNMVLLMAVMLPVKVTFFRAVKLWNGCLLFSYALDSMLQAK